MPRKKGNETVNRRSAALAIECPACDAPPHVYCRKWVGGRWVLFRPRHVHKVRIDTATRAAARSRRKHCAQRGGPCPGDATCCVYREPPFVPATVEATLPPPADRKLADDLATARAEAHKMCLGMLHMPCEAAARGPHHPLENTIAAAIVSAYYAGRKAPRG